jgi:hypothetical protein
VSTESQRVESRIRELEREVEDLRNGKTKRGEEAQPATRQRSPVRKRSKRTVMGWPLWEIASGPDPARSEERGHARALIAIGDRADGLIAIGGIARGGLCIGGITMGLLTLGGVSMSLLAGIGGVAIAPLAYGGASVGIVSVGGAAVGVYAKGDAATGFHATDRKEQDPEAERFFGRWFPPQQ